MAENDTAYPVNYTVTFPDRRLDRFSSFLRIVFIIPIAMVLGFLAQVDYVGDWGKGLWFGGAAIGVLFIPTLLMILFREKYPRWWYDWNFNIVKFGYRVQSFLFLLRDEYPSTDEDQEVLIELPYPDVSKELNRFMPLVKWLLAIPHYIVLFFLAIGLIVAVVIAWFSILFTGVYPRGLHAYVVGVQRWSVRVEAYAFILTTDRYPPFQLDR